MCGSYRSERAKRRTGRHGEGPVINRGVGLQAPTDDRSHDKKL